MLTLAHRGAVSGPFPAGVPVNDSGFGVVASLPKPVRCGREYQRADRKGNKLGVISQMTKADRTCAQLTGANRHHSFGREGAVG